jgi:hypothetical protein
VIQLDRLLFVGLLFTADPALAEERMTASAIHATFFTGQPFNAATPSGAKFEMTFTPDGKMTREPLDSSGTKNNGTWKLSANGFCTTWVRSKSNCFTITAIGENKWSVERVATTISTRVAVWSK